MLPPRALKRVDFTASAVAARRGIDNTPPAYLWPTIDYTLFRLNALQVCLGIPLHLDSGFRCLELNTAVGGAAGSQHMLGQAGDLIALDGTTPYELAEAIRRAHAGDAFDQLILEYNWVHVSFDKYPRKQIFTKPNAQSRYLPGLIKPA